MKPAPCIVSAAEHAGWAHFVSVAAPGGVPAVVERRRVALIGEGLPTMPYHHESIGMPEEEANALIAHVRRSVAECALCALRAVVADLTPSYAVVALAIREPPFPDLPDTVVAVRKSYRLQCAADGMMYQLALCRAARDLGLDVYQRRRGEDTSVAGRPAGPPWTKEHRWAYAAGVTALAAHARRRRNTKA